MDDLRTRLDALEHHIHTLQQHTQTVERRLRWWRGLAGGLLVLAVLTWALPVVTADDAKHDDKKSLAQRVAALEKLLKHFTRVDNEVFITGANLHIINGLGQTNCTDEQGETIPDCPNGVGNLIVGYNEPRGFEENVRTGSHNVVVGQFHNFSRFGGLVVGEFNTISGDFATVSGGSSNTASGLSSAVSGGNNNRASGEASSVSGGIANVASGPGLGSAVSGGQNNRANGEASSVSGGVFNLAGDPAGQVAGGELTGPAVSGGRNNTASGGASSVSGGENITADVQNSWAAGSFGGEISGSFRSP
jgi:hypothetical protein